MKPIGKIHQLPAIDSWQRQPQMKNALLHRVQKVTSEIHSIQAEMHGELTEPAGGSRMAGLFEDGSAVQVLNDFKAELDQLRRILWFYIEQAQSNATQDSEQQSKRLQRVNELLRALAPQPSTSGTSGEPNKPSISFFERLDLVMDTYLQEKKPVAHAKSAKAGN